METRNAKIWFERMHMAVDGIIPINFKEDAGQNIRVKHEMAPLKDADPEEVIRGHMCLPPEDRNRLN